MTSYIYAVPVVDCIIPFLSNKEYISLLITCKEFKDNYDRKIEWMKRSPFKTNCKQNAIIKDLVKQHGHLTLMYQASKVSTLNLLITHYRKTTDYETLMDVYYEYLHSDCPSFHHLVRVERMRIGMDNGIMVKTAKRRKRFDDNQHHMPINRLQLCR